MKIHVSAISLDCPTFCTGIMSMILCTYPLDNLSKPSVFSIGPGEIPTTLIFLGPSSTAMCLVRASTPAFAVPACAWNMVPLQCRLALMFIITPSLFIAYWTVILERRKVPTVSIMRTVLKALGVSFSNGERKLPAAPFTRIWISPCFQTMDLTVASIQVSFLTSQELPQMLGFAVSWAKLLTALLMFQILRLMMQTDAPWIKNCLAISQQIPVAPPLMRANLPLSTSGRKTEFIDMIRL